MDPRVMELRIKQWIPIIEEQAKSGVVRHIKSYSISHFKTLFKITNEEVPAFY